MSGEAGRPKFSGKFGMIMVAAGSAVGLGNLWRFPYLAHEHGGGLFLLVYIVLVVSFGFTLMITEMAIGRRTGKSCIGAVMELSKKHKWLGWLMILPPALVVPYYCVIGGWVTNYAFQYGTGSGAALTDPDYFETFITCSGDILNNPITWFVVFAVITFYIVSRGLEKGIEKSGKILMPLLLIIMAFLLIYTFTIPGVMGSVGEYLNFDYSKFSMDTVIDAAGQMFYSMSLAMGIMVTYGSYTNRDVHLESSVKQISILDTGVAMLAGLLIVPSVMALGGGVVNSGPGLMFETMPLVFGSIAFGDIIAFAFFALVFIAALTSSMSLMEVLVAAMSDHVGWSRAVARKRASFLALVLILIVGLPSCLGYGPLEAVQVAGMTILDFFDFASNTVILPLVAICTCLFISFVVGTDAIVEEVEINGRFKRKKMYLVMIKVVCPILLALILIFGVVDVFGIDIF